MFQIGKMYHNGEIGPLGFYWKGVDMSEGGLRGSSVQPGVKTLQRLKLYVTSNKEGFL